MSADEHLSPGQFPQHMAALKSRVTERHQDKRDAGDWPEKPRRDELFHGTNAALPEGALITTRAVNGRESQAPNNTPNDSTFDTEGRHTFATNDISTAYAAGRQAADNEVKETGDDYYGAIASAHVYEVHPTGRIRPDAEQVDRSRGREFSPEEVTDFQSRQPLRVGREVSRGAKQAYKDNFGDD
jgi:hypothetical protein